MSLFSFKHNKTVKANNHLNEFSQFQVYKKQNSIFQTMMKYAFMPYINIYTHMIYTPLTREGGENYITE